MTYPDTDENATDKEEPYRFIVVNELDAYKARHTHSSKNVGGDRLYVRADVHEAQVKRLEQERDHLQRRLAIALDTSERCHLCGAVGLLTNYSCPLIRKCKSCGKTWNEFNEPRRVLIESKDTP